MRTSVFFILLATASMPALAAGPDGQGRGFSNGTRAERSERSGGDNGQRTERAASTEDKQNVQRVERSERARAPRVEQPQPVVQSGQSSGQSNGFSGRRNRSGNGSNDAAQPAPVVSRDNNAGATNWRSRERYSGGKTSPTIPTTTQQTQSSRYSGDRSGTNWRDRTRTSGTTTTTTTNRLSNWSDHNKNHDGRRWSSNWRNDHRYNWRSYRSRYSSLFHLGRYYDPFGYGYRRFSIGYSLYPSYYNNSSFWLDDPWQYRLPPAYGPYRWIRYYNDALLVDTYTGEVVDVIYGFFW